MMGAKHNSEELLIPRYKGHLSEDSPVPLYSQLVEVIQNYIDDADLPNGARIPSEGTFAAHLGVGRQTVNKAFNLLIEKGTLKRIGRRGAVVDERPQVSWVLNGENFDISKALENLDIQSRVVLLSKQKIASVKRINNILQIPDQESLICIRRVRYVNDDPIQLADDFFSYRQYKELLNIDDPEEFNSIKNILVKQFGENLTRVNRRITARNIDSESAKKFGITPMQSCLTILGTYYNNKDMPLTYHEAVINTDICCLELEHIVV